MDYRTIVTVSGLSGLFELIHKKGDGSIVKSLQTKTTQFISGRGHQFSALHSIEVYSRDEQPMFLLDVFQDIKSANLDMPDIKNDQAVINYFEKISPNLDVTQIKIYDLRKMINWYNQLDKNDVALPQKET
ncbi:MAG: DUF5606 domain-containing protein [Phycisphaerales bacterium]|nr:DUF5606 domain-containing protein [Phycisphaerales bacterium]